MKKLMSYIGVCALLLGMASCTPQELKEYLDSEDGKEQTPGDDEKPGGEEPASASDITALYFLEDNVPLYIKESKYIEPIIETKGKADKIALSWSSSDPTVASVSGEGIVTGLKAGEVKIIVSATGKEEVRGQYTLVITKYDGWEGELEMYKWLKKWNFNSDIYYTSNNVHSTQSYIHNLIMLSEVRGDNICLSGHTTDPMFGALTLSDEPTSHRTTSFWMISYLIIDLANQSIRLLDPSLKDDQFLIGEAYFFRAFAHLNLVKLFARPYSDGASGAGIPLRLETGEKEVTVGDVYDSIEEDLKKAVTLMEGYSRQSNGGISDTAAKALLARVYLYMGKDADCVQLCDELLGSDPASHLDSDLAGYPAHTWSSPETIWCIANIDNWDASLIIEVTDWSSVHDERALLGAWYYTSDYLGGHGWAEMNWSDPLLDLIGRYPQDKRFQAYFEQFHPLNDGRLAARWPIDTADPIYPHWEDRCAYDIKELPDEEHPVSVWVGDKEYTIRKETANGYPCYYTLENDIKTPVRFCDNYAQNDGSRNTFPIFMMKKFSGQENYQSFVNATSPVILRWAEVILNRAEANAHLGKNQEALSDVNIIRARAGLTGDAQMTLSNYAGRGYGSVLDVVLDERRMELCFEGHRATDLLRNKKDLDRRYAGYHPWEVIPYNDSRFPYPSPEIQ